MNPYRLIAGLVAALVLIALVMWGPTACSALQSQKKATEVAERDAGAMLDSVDEANDTSAGFNDEAGEIAAGAADAADGIRNAPAGNSNAAADEATCKLKSYRNDPDCVALRASKENPDAP